MSITLPSHEDCKANCHQANYESLQRFERHLLRLQPAWLDMSINNVAKDMNLRKGIAKQQRTIK